MSIPAGPGRSGAARERERGRKPELPVLPPQVLERPGLPVRSDFVGLSLDAVRRVRHYANSLRGELLKSDGRYRTPDDSQERS